MIKYQVFSDNEWTYPDMEISQSSNISLFAARGSDVCFQVVTDYVAMEEGTVQLEVTGLPEKCDVVLYQMLPAHVEENSDSKMLTTKDYESVKHFVTRKAPYDVYEITKLVCDNLLTSGRVAFWVRVNVSNDAVPGSYSTNIKLLVAGQIVELSVELKIYKTQVPSLENANFHMVNWIEYKDLARQHNVEMWSEEYGVILERYMENELDMRTDYLMIPAGEPIRDEQGKVVDFDFSNMEFVGEMAVKKGYKKIMGGFVARFREWDDDDHLLLWDSEVKTTSLEAFRQLRIYFAKAWECVVKHGWEDCYLQCLVDEPQFPNSLAYRALSGICRQQMPGIQIHDPVETTDIYGALDVWVVKQATYEQYIDVYREIQEMGEEIWLYTCGFPGGAVMNRVIDLPLTVSRLPMWMCYEYDAAGFLHWGYNLHNPEIEKMTCYQVEENILYPAGNSFVVYPGDKAPNYGVRAHAQRSGAYDYELFYQLGLKENGKEKAKQLIERVCRGFNDYNPSASLLDEIRHELLEILG